MTKTIAIYARKNQSDEAADQSIEAQMRKCLAVSKRQYGDNTRIVLYKVEGVGGQALYKPALRSLQHDVETKAIAAAIVTSSDRIDRSTNRTLDTIHWLREKHIDCVAAEDKLRYMWDDAHADVKRLLWNLETEMHSKRMKTAWTRRKAKQQAANN